MPNAYHVVVLKGNGAEDVEQYEEGVAGGAILPGDLIKLHSDGTYIRNAEADVKVECLVATEDMQCLRGNTIADAYASGDPLSFVKAQSGMELQVRVTASQTMDTASFLTPSSAGKMKEVASTEFRMAKCLETVTSSTADDLVAVRIL